jgi:hypothetical protein
MQAKCKLDDNNHAFLSQQSGLDKSTPERTLAREASQISFVGDGLRSWVVVATRNKNTLDSQSANFSAS